MRLKRKSWWLVGLLCLSVTACSGGGDDEEYDDEEEDGESSSSGGGTSSSQAGSTSGGGNTSQAGSTSNGGTTSYVSSTSYSGGSSSWGGSTSYNNNTSFGGSTSSGGASGNPLVEPCGELPELPYVCPGGTAPACECVDHQDGTFQWHCSDCPSLDCNATPTDPACAKDVACIRCHGLQTANGGQGIENPHPWRYVACVDCHGGVGRDPANPDRILSKSEAHVPMPAEMTQSGTSNTPKRTSYENHYLGRGGVENLNGGLQWLRFTNPGDLRVVDQTCSTAACHPGIDTKVKNSTMATLVGKFDAMLYQIGLPRPADLAPALGYDSYGKRLAVWGAAHRDDSNWNRNTSPPGSVPHIHALESFDREINPVFSEQDIAKETMNKLCGSCHLGNNGWNHKAGKFRSSGCTACHMPYDWTGRSQSNDPLINKEEPTYPAAYEHISWPERPHPRRHQITRNMKAGDCLSCHTGSARLVFQYMGIRVDDNKDLTKARDRGVDINFQYSQLVNNDLNPDARLHGFDQEKLIEYEDLNEDGQDDTPPDVHYLAGMECVDCHSSADMHGDGRIYSRQDQAVKVRCVHCHGNLEFPADPDAANNAVNELYLSTGRIQRKNLFKFETVPGYGEEGYPQVTTPGIWLRTKTTREWKWVPQIAWGVKWDPNGQDCFGEGLRTDPRNGQFVCNPLSSIAHGRWNGLSANGGDLEDGVGPRPGVEVVQGGGGTQNVQFGFSHVGEAAYEPNEVPAGGLECAACHSTWHNMRYGNHLGIKDIQDGNRLYDWDRVTGEVTLGTQGWFNFTYVSMLDQQLIIDSKGKIAWGIPARLKLFMRHRVLGAGGAEVEYMQDALGTNFPWKTYRDRVGMGNIIHESQGGIVNAPGFAQTCVEPNGFCDQDDRKNINGGLGVDTNQPHSTSPIGGGWRTKDCRDCHLDNAGGGLTQVSALYGWNPNGRTPQTSAYLNKITQVEAAHGTYSTANGFVIADDGIQHRLDHMVDEETGYPLVNTMHVRIDDGRDGRPRRGYDTWDQDAAGPITQYLIDRLKNIRVNNIYGN
ncbi:MAG: hypothetical protein AB2A00_05510 [Myxococcota bacterium]